jgi:hypothetical protein
MYLYLQLLLLTLRRDGHAFHGPRLHSRARSVWVSDMERNSEVVIGEMVHAERLEVGERPQHLTCESGPTVHGIGDSTSGSVVG